MQPSSVDFPAAFGPSTAVTAPGVAEALDVVQRGIFPYRR